MTMKVIHVCVGKTKEQNIRGQAVKTAFLKSCVSGPIRIDRSGIEGNDVAVHTDAVYAIAQEHYQYWANKLGADSKDWPPGFFAENLMISKLDEGQLRVGDVVAIGEQVRLTVSGPRVPCFKLCWRLRQPESFIREFALSGKSGVYFNVEQAGDIRAGDEVKIISKATHSVGINELVQYIFGEKEIDLDLLRYILKIPGLSETSVLLLRNKLYQIVDQERTSKHRWRGWREFIVDRIIQETAQIKSFILRPKDNQLLAPYRAGQFLTVNFRRRTRQA